MTGCNARFDQESSLTPLTVAAGVLAIMALGTSFVSFGGDSDGSGAMTQTARAASGKPAEGGSYFPAQFMAQSPGSEEAPAQF